MDNFEDVWQGNRLITAEIFYHMPDHPSVLQSYIWQEFDLPPYYPRLNSFLKFWLREIEGKLHSIQLCTGGELMPHKIKTPSLVMSVH